MALLSDYVINAGLAKLTEYIDPQLSALIAGDVADWAEKYVHKNGLLGKLEFVFYNKIMQICNNFDPKSHVNRGQIARINLVNVDAGRFEPEELRPDIWISYIEEYEKKEELVWTRESETVDTEECPNCLKREVWVYTMQLRSMDEGTTMRVICKPCGNAWTHNN